MSRSSKFGPDDYDGPERRHIDLLQNQRILNLEQQIADISVVMRASVYEGMRAAMTDPEVLAAMWGAAMKQSQVALHQRAGRWLFSKWTAILAFVMVLASYIGWPATLKLLAGVVKGGD